VSEASADAPILEKCKAFFLEHVKPYAELIDQDPGALKLAFDKMCVQELMALRRPAKYGGPEISEKGFRTFQEMSARYSGALSFLTTQHQSAVSMLARSDNESLKNDYLPKMANGEVTAGIGFSQLRRPGPPVMRAESCDGGYLLNGQVPWITGYTFYKEFLIGATLPDGHTVFGFVPLESTHEIKLGEVMRLAALESPQTVSAEITNYHLPEGKVVFVKRPDWAKKNDMINIVLQGHFALGCAQAGIDCVRAAFEKKGLSFVDEAANALEKEVEECRKAAAKVPVGMDSEITKEKLELRAWAIDLAVRCGHGAVTSWSGAANSVWHPAQRIYREALVYTVSAQTSDIMQATLERLTGPRKGKASKTRTAK